MPVNYQVDSMRWWYSTEVRSSASKGTGSYLTSMTAICVRCMCLLNLFFHLLEETRANAVDFFNMVMKTRVFVHSQKFVKGIRNRKGSKKGSTYSELVDLGQCRRQQSAAPFFGVR